VKCREEKATRSQCELRRVLEGLAVQLSSPARFVDAQEESIRERIRELQHECKERSVVSFNLCILVYKFFAKKLHDYIFLEKQFFYSSMYF
jgi:hypothetical protein